MKVSSYGKSIPKTRMVPVIVTLLAENEGGTAPWMASACEISSAKLSRGSAWKPMLKGGCITAAELALLLKTTPPTIPVNT